MGEKKENDGEENKFTYNALLMNRNRVEITANDLVDEDVAIKDEETPLAVEKSSISGRAWWYWILIIISAITGNVAKNKEKATQKEMEEKDK